MSSALRDPSTEDSTPASRIMRERDEHREAWAREYTRANTLEAALERSQQATSDWQGIAIHNGEEAAKARVEAALSDAALKRIVGELADEKYRNGQLIAENVRLLAKYEADTKRLREDLAAYRDSLIGIYDATAGQTGPVVDTIHSTMRELADNDIYDNDPMFDVCQTCGPFDRDYNPMPGCRDCFGGKVVA